MLFWDWKFRIQRKKVCGTFNNFQIPNVNNTLTYSWPSVGLKLLLYFDCEARNDRIIGM